MMKKKMPNFLPFFLLRCYISSFSSDDASSNSTDTCLRIQFLIPIQIFSDAKMEGYPLGEAQESPLVEKNGPDHLKGIWAPAITPRRLSRKAQNSAQNWGSLKAEIRKIYIDEDNTLASTMKKIEADYGFKAW
jgi:hypothetical protein